MHRPPTHHAPAPHASTHYATAHHATLWLDLLRLTGLGSLFSLSGCFVRYTTKCDGSERNAEHKTLPTHGDTSDLLLKSFLTSYRWKFFSRLLSPPGASELRREARHY